MRRTRFDHPIPPRFRLQAAAAPGPGEGGDSGGGEGDDSGGGGGGGTPPDSWNSLKSGLPDHLRSLPDLDTSKSFESFVSQYHEQSKMIGADRTTIPGEGAPLGDVHSFLKKLGRPDESKDYDLGQFKPPENLPWNESFVPKMLEKFHGSGMNSEQVRRVLQGYGEIESEYYQGISESVQTQRDETMQGLRKEFGNETDALLERGQKAFRTWLGEDFEQVEGLRFSDGTGLGDRPEMLRAMIRLSELTGEHGLAGEGSGTSAARMGDADSIRMELGRMQSDPEVQTILNDRGHPRYKEIQRKWNGLLESMGDTPLSPVKGMDDL